MMEQLIAHLIGDYFLQSDWQALNKTKKFWIACVHGTLYVVPFYWFFHLSMAAHVTIVSSHILIDHYGLARYVVWLHNWIGLKRPAPWASCQMTGFGDDRPIWLTVWLTIIVDNTMHLTINYLALRYL